jgi:hypothetical protein
MVTLLQKRLPVSARTWAWGCVLINQLATPGLGSIIGRRFVSGAGQLLLAVGGFVMIVGWMVRFYYDSYREAIGQKPVGGPYGWWGKWGLILFGAGWLWALFTSLSLLRQAKRNPPAGPEPVPPRLGVPTGKM